MTRPAGARRLPLPLEPSSRLKLQWLSFWLVAAALLAAPVLGFAQDPKPASPTSAPAAKLAASAPVKVVVSKPTWAELSPMQQKALAPLASSWNTVSEPQKRKWLEISKNFPSLPPEGQANLHSRMNEWVTLSPQQRAQARLNFGKTKELSKQLTPEEKKAKWETYQALSPEEKQKLAAKASPRPTGAATAVKPVAPQKLAPVPPHPVKAASKPAPKIGASQPVAAATPAALPASAPGATPQR
ncbi:Protein of unknown function (DUF3106) [Polaromonas sp. CF318]|nr:Protein of unknown function (DUF3106) [Polaromonas sp. CF318]